MARIGELLVTAGLLSAEHLEEALRAQVVWGARLGTNLVERGLIDLDELSTQLARQHKMPAALARHFEKVDPELQRRLRPETAELFSVVPMFRVGPEKKVILATVSPLSREATEAIAQGLGLPAQHVIVAIAAELRVRYQLERVYRVARPARFMRTPNGGIPSVPQISQFEEDSDVENPLLSAVPVAIDDQHTYPHEPEPETLPVAVGPTDDVSDLELDQALSNLTDAPPPAPVEEVGRERRRYVRTVTDPGLPDADRKVARIAIRKVPAGTLPSRLPNTLGEATRVIRRATDRDRVAELCMETLDRYATTCEAATLLVVRGHVATSWKGFGRSQDVETEISVPLDQASLVARATDNNLTSRLAASDLGPIDRILFASLGQAGRDDLDLVTIPIPISGHVVCLLALACERGAASGTAETIAAAVGAAFTRLMRNASR